MQTDKHLFQFSAKDISSAARGEAEYHSRRLEYWEREQDKAINMAKSSGVRVDIVPVTGGRRVQMYVDQTIQAHLNLCGQKIDEHNQAVDQFEIEAATYATQGDRTYELDPKDVMHFRLAGGPRKE